MQEKQIEDAFIQWLSDTDDIEDWIVLGRQIYIPGGGIIDILCYEEISQRYVVVEIKRGIVNAAAMGQLWGYLYILKETLANHIPENVFQNVSRENYEHIIGCVVGTGLDRMAKRLLSGTNLEWIKYTDYDGEIEFSPQIILTPEARKREVFELHPVLNQMIHELVGTAIAEYALISIENKVNK